MVLMKLRTLFEVFALNLCTNSQEHKEYGKGNTFEYFYGLLIIDQHILLEEGKLGGRHKAHFIKGNSNMDPRDKARFDASTQKIAYRNHKPKEQIDAPQWSRKKKTCQYCGKTRHVEKVFFKKRGNSEDKVKHLEGDMFDVCQPTDNFTFQVKNSQDFLSHSA